MEARIVRLKKIHEKLKAHEFRFDMQTMSGDYFYLFDALIDELFVCVREAFNGDPARMAGVTSLAHDARNSIGICKTYAEIGKLNNKYYDHFLHLEHVVGVIHRFIDAGVFDEIWCLSPESNNNPVTRLIFSEALRKWEPVKAFVPA